MRKNPLKVHIRITKSNRPIGEIRPDENRETSLETALRMVGEVKKVHPNAEICVEVEV